MSACVTEMRGDYNFEKRCRLGLGQGLRCALRQIDDDLYLIVRAILFCGVAARRHATSLFAWSVCFLRGATSDVCYSYLRTLGHGRACEGRFVGAS